MPVVIPTVTKEALNTALALESTGVVIVENVVQEAATTAVSVSVSTIGDAVAPVLTDLSAAVSAKVAEDTGISVTDLVVVEAEVVVAAPVAAAPVAAPVAAATDAPVAAPVAAATDAPVTDAELFDAIAGSGGAASRLPPQKCVDEERVIADGIIVLIIILVLGLLACLVCGVWGLGFVLARRKNKVDPSRRYSPTRGHAEKKQDWNDNLVSLFNDEDDSDEFM